MLVMEMMIYCCYLLGTRYKPSILRTFFPLTSSKHCKMAVIIPTLRMCKLKVRDEMTFQGHTADKWQSWQSDRGAPSCDRGDHSTVFSPEHPMPGLVPTTHWMPNSISAYWMKYSRLLSAPSMLFFQEPRLSCSTCPIRHFTYVSSHHSFSETLSQIQLFPL